jgi:hypothetical protein
MPGSFTSSHLRTTYSQPIQRAEGRISLPDFVAAYGLPDLLRRAKSSFMVASTSLLGHSSSLKVGSQLRWLPLAIRT